MRARIQAVAGSLQQDMIVSVAVVENDAETCAGWVKLLDGLDRYMQYGKESWRRAAPHGQRRAPADMESRGSRL
jgi:hypothetical protein